MTDSPMLTICSFCGRTKRLIDTLQVPVFEPDIGFLTANCCEGCLPGTVRDSASRVRKAACGDAGDVLEQWAGYGEIHSMASAEDDAEDQPTIESLLDEAYGEHERLLRCRDLVLTSELPFPAHELRRTFLERWNPAWEEVFEEIAVRSARSGEPLGEVAQAFDSSPGSRSEPLTVTDVELYLRGFNFRDFSYAAMGSGSVEKMLGGRAMTGPVPPEEMPLVLAPAGPVRAFVEEAAGLFLAYLNFQSLSEAALRCADAQCPSRDVACMALLFFTCALSRNREDSPLRPLVGEAVKALDAFVPRLLESGQRGRKDLVLPPFEPEDINAVIDLMLFPSAMLFDGDNDLRAMVQHMRKAVEWGESDYLVSRPFYRAYFGEREQMELLIEEEMVSSQRDRLLPFVDSDVQFKAWLELLLRKGDLSELWELLAEPDLWSGEWKAVVRRAAEKGVPGLYEQAITPALAGHDFVAVLEIVRDFFGDRELSALRVTVDALPGLIAQPDQAWLLSPGDIGFLALRLLAKAGPEDSGLVPASRAAAEQLMRFREERDPSTVSPEARLLVAIFGEQDTSQDREDAERLLDWVDRVHDDITGMPSDRTAAILARLPFRLAEPCSYEIRSALPSGASWISVAPVFDGEGFESVDQVLLRPSREIEAMVVSEGPEVAEGKLHRRRWRGFCHELEELGLSFAAD